MILGRNLNQIGYVNRDLNPVDGDLHLFLLHIFESVTKDHSRGISVTCLEIHQGFPIFDFSLIEEDSKESSVIWDIFQFIKSSKHRIFFFLPNYYFLGSQIPSVIEDSKSLISSLSILLDQIGIRETSIILRVGSAYGARKVTLDRFCSEIESMENSVIEKLSVCNDEKPSLFSVTDLLSGVFYRINIPIVFRFLPHQFNSGGLSTREAYFLAVSTWVKNKIPVFIHSESSEVDENGVSLSPSASSSLSYRIPTFGLEIDVIIDMPSGLDGCLSYLSRYISLKPMVINKVGKK
jgi:hypothetical protein